MMRFAFVAATTLAAAATLAACGSGPNSANSPPSSSPPAQHTLLSGNYVGGPRGTPHYFITLTVASDGSFAGSVQYVFQDGQTAVVIPFTGSAQSGVATLNVGQIPNTGRSWLTATNAPSSISATYTSSSLNLGECASYLSVQSLSQCDFSYSPTGAL